MSGFGIIVSSKNLLHGRIPGKIPALSNESHLFYVMLKRIHIYNVWNLVRNRIGMRLCNILKFTVYLFTITRPVERISCVMSLAIFCEV